MRTELPRVEVDTRPSWDDLQAGSTLNISRAYAARQRRMGAEAVQRIAREGDALGAPEKGATVASVARQRGVRAERPVTIKALPSRRPRVDVELGRVRVWLAEPDKGAVMNSLNVLA